MLSPLSLWLMCQAVWLYETAILLSDDAQDVHDMMRNGNYDSLIALKVGVFVVLDVEGYMVP